MPLFFLGLKYHTFIGSYMTRDRRISLLIRFVTDCLQKYIGFTNLKDVSTLRRRLWDWSTWYISYVSQQQTYISKTFKWDIYSQKANIYENPCKISHTSRPNLHKKVFQTFKYSLKNLRCTYFNNNLIISNTDGMYYILIVLYLLNKIIVLCLEHHFYNLRHLMPCVCDGLGGGGSKTKCGTVISIIL